MKATVYLSKEQLIKLAGIAATSDSELIGVSQEIRDDGIPISTACLATTAKDGKQGAEIVTQMGTVQNLTGPLAA